MPAASSSQLGQPASTAKLLAELSRMPARLADVFEDLSNWERIWRPEPTKWNCSEIAGHLLDAELAFGYRIRCALAEPGKKLDAFAQDEWVAALGYTDTPVDDTLDTFTALRRNLVQLAVRLTDAEMQRHYEHSVRGRQTVLDTLELLKVHDARHLVQLGRVSELARQARPLD